jgi:signal transduction histidine kinase/CheY-like chemotaxis protein
VDMARYDTLYDINMSCVAAVDILNDLLCYDKLGSGALELHKEEIVVESYVQSSLSMFTAQANESGASLQLLPLPDNHTITENGAYSALGLNRIHLPVHSTDVIIADKFKIDQVLRNVISNALKFTPRGGSVTMTVSFMPDIIMKTSPPITRYKSISGLKTRDVTDTSLSIATKETRRSKPKPYKWLRTSSAVHCETDLEKTKRTINGMLVIVITDTGAGINIENQGRLFKEVVQFSPEKLQAGGGSGLGLWITSGILEMHKGKISVYSEGEGYGSSFTIQLPMSRQDVLSSPLSPSLSSSLVPLLPSTLKGTCCHNDNHINNNNNNRSNNNSNNNSDNNDNQSNDVNNDNRCNDNSNNNLANTNSNNNIINNSYNNYMENYNDENDIESIGSSADGTESELNDNYNTYTDSPRCVYCPSPLLNTSNTQDTYQLLSLDLLIIDDSPINCKMLIKCLTAVGHSCVSGSDGVMAIAMVKERIDYANGGKGRPFDAILMDFMMPNMDGPSATKIIRSMGYTAPILGLTGNG